MSFFLTPVRRLCLVRGWAFLVLAGAMVAFSFVYDVDAQGRIFCYIMAGVIAAFAIFNFWQARRAHPEETVTTNPELLPPNAQITYYRQLLRLSLFGFPALFAFVAYDLHQLESGAAETVRLWAPLAWLYGRWGYWPTVLSIPALWLVCWWAFRFKIRALTDSLAKSSATAPGNRPPGALS